MSDNRIKDFFYPGKAVHGEPDYGLADNFVRTAEVLINALVNAFLSNTPSGEKIVIKSEPVDSPDLHVDFLETDYH